MDKRPSTLSVKNFLIRKVASEMNLPDKIVEVVTDHQLGGVVEAVRQRKGSVEISGFGKFVFNERRAKATMEKIKRVIVDIELSLQSDELTKVRRRNAEIKLNNLQKELLEFKTNERSRDI